MAITYLPDYNKQEKTFLTKPDCPLPLLTPKVEYKSRNVISEHNVFGQLGE